MSTANQSGQNTATGLPRDTEHWAAGTADSHYVPLRTSQTSPNTSHLIVNFYPDSTLSNLVSKVT